MKRLIAAAAAAALVVALAVFCHLQTQKTAAEVAAKTKAIIASAENGTTTGLEQDFCSYWDKQEPLLSLFMNHGTLQEIGATATKMAAAARQQEFFEVSAAAQEIAYTVQKAYEDEKLHWAALF